MPRGKGQRAGLSRDQVMETARRLARERGLPAVTIRGVAEALGVAPNALYAWVPSKVALLDALVDDVLADMPGPEVGGTPQALLLDLFDALLRHGEFVPLFLSRQHSPGPHTSAVRSALERRLAATGADSEAVATAVPVLFVNAIGFAAFVLQTNGEALLLDTPSHQSARDLYARSAEWLIQGALSDEGALQLERLRNDRAAAGTAR